MEHVHWWLAGLAFTLGMVLTSTLMVRPVEHQVLVKKSVRGSSAKSKPPTARKPAVKSGTKREESPTAKTKVATESAAEQIPVAGEPAAEPIPVAGEPAARIPVVPYAPYGPGSARAGADGSGPQGWLVKGRSDTRLYYSRRSDVRPYCRPGLVPGRGVGSAGVFHAVAQEHTADMRSGPQG